MNIESFRDYCLSKKGVTESFPFDEETLVFKVMGKIFSICPLERIPSQVNLKCDPEWSVELRETYDGHIYPGFHLNKEHWNTIEIEKKIPDDLLIKLTDHSYDLIVAKFPKKVKEEFDKL